MALAVGTLVAGRYLIEAALGAGGMGEVYRARDERLGRGVALKMLPLEALGDQTARARLVREARAAAQLEHPGIVHVYDVDETDDGGALLVMELVSGRTFGAMLQEGRLSLAERRRVLVEAARALGFAHKRGLLHRDVKPDNVMVREDGRAVLLDFGLAKQARETSAPAAAGQPTLTREGIFLGTPAYVAPEQARGEALDGRADQFALAVVAYEAFTGVSPWKGSSPVSLLSQVLSVDPPLPTSLDKALPPAIDAVLGRALEKRPEDRYPSIEAFADALESLTLTSATPGPISAEVMARASAPTEILSAATASKVEEPARAPASRRRFAALAGVVALAVAAVVGIAARRDPPKAAPTVAVMARPGARLACPALRVEGVEAPNGWLGAAAAAMACDRARLTLGGAYGHTLAPAELLDLPREPVESMPVDPYDAPEARATAVRRAREQGDAWLDGAVLLHGDRFQVELIARHGEAEIGRASGVGDALYEAVYAALDVLVARGVVPRAARLDPEVEEWIPAAGVAEALLIMEAHAGLVQYTRSLGALCDRLLRAPARLGEHEVATRWVCTYVRGEPGVPRLAPWVSSPPTGRAVLDAELRIAMDPTVDPRAITAPLLERLATEPSALGKARLSAVASCYLQPLGRDEEAIHLAIRAVRALPNDSEGWACFGWAQLSTLSRDPASRRVAMRGFQAWMPWSSMAWIDDGSTPEIALRNARRAYLLAPFNALVVLNLGDLLFSRGLLQEARAVAVAMDEGGAMQKLLSAILLVKIAEQEAQLGAALDRAQRTLAMPPGAGYANELRWELGARALSVARILGRDRETSDAFLRPTIDADPLPFDPTDAFTPPRLAALCAVASKDLAMRCFARLGALVRTGAFSNLTEGGRAIIDGAEAYARGDMAAAARIFRPLVRHQGAQVSLVADLMADTFARQGDDTLVEVVDAPALAAVAKGQGASLASVRAARRAAKAGDRDKAREHAERVIRAWSVADVDVPAVAEMRALLAKLR